MTKVTMVIGNNLNAAIKDHSTITMHKGGQRWKYSCISLQYAGIEFVVYPYNKLPAQSWFILHFEAIHDPIHEYDTYHATTKKSKQKSKGICIKEKQLFPLRINFHIQRSKTRKGPHTSIITFQHHSLQKKVLFSDMQLHLSNIQRSLPYMV